MWRTSQSIHAMASSKTGAPVVAVVTERPFRVSPSSTAGFENLTNTLVSSLSHRLTVNAPLAEINRWVTAELSTPMPTSTGSIESCVIQLVVIPLRSPSCAEPTSARALGIFQVIRLSSSSSSAMQPG